MPPRTVVTKNSLVCLNWSCRPRFISSALHASTSPSQVSGGRWCFNGSQIILPVGMLRQLEFLCFMIIKYHHLSYSMIFRAQLMTTVHSGVIISSEAKRALDTCLRFGRVDALVHLTWHPFLELSLSLSAWVMAEPKL